MEKGAKWEYFAAAFCAAGLGIVWLVPVLGIWLFPFILPLGVFVWLRFGRAACLGLFLGFVAAVLIFKRDLLLIFYLPCVAVCFTALLLCTKKWNYRHTAGIMALTSMCAMIFGAGAFSAVLKKQGADIVSDYVNQPQNPIFVVFAQLNYMQTVPKNERVQLDDKQLIDAWRAEIERELELELPYYIIGYAAMLACAVTLLMRAPLLMMGDEAKKKGVEVREKFKEITLPKEYGFYVLIPLLLFYLYTLLARQPLLTMLSNTLFYSLVIVPFGFAGITYGYYLVSLAGQSRARMPLFSLLCVFCICGFIFSDIFTLISILGFADYLANTRRIIDKIFK